MRFSRKMIESIAVAGMAAALTVTSITTSGESSTERKDTIEMKSNGIAGIAAILDEYKAESEELSLSVGVDREIATIVTAAARKTEETDGIQVAPKDMTAESASLEDASSETQDTQPAAENMPVSETQNTLTPAENVPDSEMQNSLAPEVNVPVSETQKTLTPEEEEWQDKLMADVKNFLYIRAEADQDSKALGKLYKGDRALIKEEGDEWTLIASGKVKGYVKNEFCLFGADALAYAKENCDIVAEATVNGLRIRSEASLEAAIVETMVEGDKALVDEKTQAPEGWVAVLFDQETCYVSAEYVKVKPDTGKAVSMEEEAAAAAAASAKTSKASGQTASSGMVQGEALAADVDEETLLAALVECETGNCGVKCMTAVGAVVVNRVRNGNYPNNIHDVIYQRGQFGPASSGRLAQRLKIGPSASAREAARAALAGNDPTDGALYFRLASSGHDGVVIGPVVFYKRF